MVRERTHERPPKGSAAAGSKDHGNRDAHGFAPPPLSWRQRTLLIVSGLSLAFMCAIKLAVAEAAVLDALRGTVLAPIIMAALVVWSTGSRSSALWAPPLAAS